MRKTSNVRTKRTDPTVDCDKQLWSGDCEVCIDCYKRSCCKVYQDFEESSSFIPYEEFSMMFEEDLPF